MAVEEARRRELRRAVAEALGEEVAETLMDLVAPSGQELATREDIRGVLDVLSAMDDRWEERLSAMDDRWGERLSSMEHRLTSTFERRIADAVTMQTRTLVFSQLGAVVVIAALAFGLR